MPNVNAVLNEQIRRLARREISANTKKTKKASAHYRRDIAALKRQVGQLHKLVRMLQSQVPNQPPTPPAEVIQKARLRVAGLKSDRIRVWACRPRTMAGCWACRRLRFTVGKMERPSPAAASFRKSCR